MSGLYTARASKSLKSLLAKAAKGGDKERLRLGDELDIARVMAERAIRLFDGACCGEGAEKASTSLKHTVSVMVRDSIKLVSDLAGQYAKLMLVSDDVFNGVQVDHIMAGIADVLVTHLEDPKLIDKILHALKDHITPDKVPTRQVSITIGA